MTLILGASMAVTAQYTKEFKRIYFDAEYLYQTGFFEEAFNRYKNLLTLDPGNSNILFHCGACCLNIPGSEQMAITYLKEAASGVKPAYKERSHKEAGAPVLTYFMLGRAYHLNNEFDKAIEQYGLYLETGVDEDPVQLQYAQLQIDACHRAAKLVGRPPSFEFQSVLDQFDDDLPSCSNPVISGDGNILIFLVDYPSDKKIMMTRRTGQVWSRPRVINSEIGMVGETYPVCLSYDGMDLYLVHQFYSHSDIFVSRFEGESWSQAEALDANVNGRTSETHASISRDGKTLYFTSDARGGLGSFDIFVSKQDPKGGWGVPKNLGPVINTPYEEHTPFISGNDSILFFSSQGHATIGGIDVFYSELGPDGNWGEPVNLGYPVNTTGEDIFFNPGWGEMEGYYAVRREDDPTSNTINMVIGLEPEEAAQEEVMPEELPPVAPAAMAPGRSPQALQAESVEKAIEPEETDEILEVLNKNLEHPAPAVPAGSTMLETSVPFDHNSCELGMAAILEVEKVADLMQVYPETRVRLTGRADATGSPGYNMLLSNQRADQVARYLELRGIAPERITLEGKGELAPVARNAYQDGSDAPLGRYLNRQVTVVILSPEPIQAQLNGSYVPISLRPEPGEDLSEAYEFWFTIQLSAATKPIKISSFSEPSNVREYSCKDGYFRYTYGQFRTFSEARAKLGLLRDSGFPDAFIQTLEWYEKASE
jgi:outer membrane protein OmpA-like peptidoglycan-associated protein/tetratricopeptide (TPR) repeat protein